MKTKSYQYKMTPEMAKSLLARKRSQLEKKMPDEEYLRYVVNETFGLMGVCSKVIIS